MKWWGYLGVWLFFLNVVSLGIISIWDLGKTIAWRFAIGLWFSIVLALIVTGYVAERTDFEKITMSYHEKYIDSDYNLDWIDRFIGSPHRDMGVK